MLWGGHCWPLQTLWSTYHTLPPWHFWLAKDSSASLCTPRHNGAVLWQILFSKNFTSRNNLTDPIWYSIGQFIGSDCVFDPRDQKLGDWIALPIWYPNYRIARDSIWAWGIGITLLYQSSSGGLVRFWPQKCSVAALFLPKICSVSGFLLRYRAKKPLTRVLA
jgi:hypothetical protein